jgi:hypothetical protein
MLMMHTMHHANIKSRPAIQNNHRITSFIGMTSGSGTDTNVRLRGVRIREAISYVKEIMATEDGGARQVAQG